MRPPDPVDNSTIPTLSGVFAPVHDERDAADLVVHGEIPADLRGAYLRNGPNPLFPPLGSYTFPLEGDAMLHGIWVDDDGSVRYRNRTVWTPQLRLEQRAGKALWAGLMTPLPAWTRCRARAIRERLQAGAVHQHHPSRRSLARAGRG